MLNSNILIMIKQGLKVAYDENWKIGKLKVAISSKISKTPSVNWVSNGKLHTNSYPLLTNCKKLCKYPLLGVSGLRQ